MNSRTRFGILLISACLVWSMPSTSSAQWYLNPSNGFGGYQNPLSFAGLNNGFDSPGYYVGGGGLGGGGFGYGGWGGVESTWSAEMKGMATLVRAEGAYKQQTAQALISYEEARRRYIDNQEKIITTRQTVKRLAQAESAKDQEAALAARDRAEKFLAANKPQPLSYRQLDQTTGAVRWPVALTGVEFDNVRKTLDTLFAAHFKAGPASQQANVSSEIRGKILEMRDVLRSQILNIPLADYSEARRFLDSMAVSVN